MALTDKLIVIANAIRIKTGKSEPLTLTEMPSEILSIQTGSSDIPFEFSGFNAELIDEHSEDFYLADTSFVAGESVSTNATVIRNSEANKYTNTTGSRVYDYGDKDIIIVQEVDTTVEHEDSAVNVAKVLKHCYVYLTFVSKRKNTDSGDRINRQLYNVTSIATKYFDTKGAIVRAASSYGLYGVPVAPTMSSSTAVSAYVKIGTPNLYYRASASYESVNNIKLVKNAHWHWTVKVYTVDPFTNITAVVNQMHDNFFMEGESASIPMMLSLEEDLEDNNKSENFEENIEP